MVDDRRRDRGQTKCRDGAIESIGGRCAHTGDKPRQAAINERAPDTEQTDRADRSRDGQADRQPTCEECNIHTGVPFSTCPAISHALRGTKNPPAGEGLVGHSAPKRCGARPYPGPPVCWTCPWTIRCRADFRFAMSRMLFSSLPPPRGYWCAVKRSRQSRARRIERDMRRLLIHLLTDFVTSVSIRTSLE